MFVRNWIFDFSHDWEGHFKKKNSRSFTNTKDLGGNHSMPNWGEGWCKCGLFILGNHDLTGWSLRDFGFERCSCATTGPLCLPSRCFQFDARPRIFSHCLPKVTYSSAIMRYTLHREDSLFFSPPYTHAHTPHGESLLSPFLQALYTRHKLLNPQNTVLWDSVGAIFRGQRGGIWHISLCWTQLPSGWITVVRKGWTWMEIQVSSPPQCEIQNETKVLQKISRSTQGRLKKSKSRTTLSEWTCLHLSNVAKAVQREPDASAMTVPSQIITRMGAKELGEEGGEKIIDARISDQTKHEEVRGWEQCEQPGELSESDTLAVSVDQQCEMSGWPVRRNF